MTKYWDTRSLEEIDRDLGELHRNAGDRNFTAEEQRQWDALEEERNTRIEHDKQVEKVREYAMRGYTEEISDVAKVVRDNAMRTLDSSIRSGSLSETAAGKAESYLKNEATKSYASRYIELTGSDAYMRAFGKLLIEPQRANLEWTKEEHAAFHAVRELQRAAMSTTDANGGYAALPFQLSPELLLVNNGTANSIYSLARKVTTPTNDWRPVTTAGSTASWDAEASSTSDDSPTLSQPSVPLHRYTCFVPYSIEIAQDFAASFTQEIGAVMRDAAERLISTALTVGTGSGQPTGIITALAGGSSEVAPTTAEAFASADIYKLIEALPARYRGQAQWMANLSIIDLISQMETTNGARLFPTVDNGSLLRRPLHENSEMDGAFDAAATADNFVLLVGDFSRFVVAEKPFSSSIELVPHLFDGTTNLPTGQRGLYLFGRMGSDVIDDNAFRVLNIETTA